MFVYTLMSEVVRCVQTVACRRISQTFVVTIQLTHFTYGLSTLNTYYGILHWYCCFSSWRLKALLLNVNWNTVKHSFCRKIVSTNVNKITRFYWNTQLTCGVGNVSIYVIGCVEVCVRMRARQREIKTARGREIERVALLVCKYIQNTINSKHNWQKVKFMNSTRCSQ